MCDPSSRRSRCSWGFVHGLLLAAILPALILPAAAVAQPERRPFLFKDARGELAQARARGETEVVLVIASMPGRNARVAAAIGEMGGRVGFRADEVDYVRAWVPNIAAYKQGNGVVNVAGAWDILRQLEAGALALDIEARSSVVTPYSHLLPTPHVGFGLYERSGWKAGERGERTVTFTRTSGPSGPMTFDVTWDGNDHGTFSSPLTVALPLGTPVDFPVTVTPAGHGVHTAHLTLHHDDVAGYALRVHAAIVAPEPLNAAGGYTAKNEVEVPRPGLKSYFFDVPEGVTALKVDVTWEVRLGDIADTRAFDWEEARKEEPVPPTAATLTVSALAADVDIVTAEIAADNGAASGEGAHQVWIANRMAPFTGAAVTTPVGSARRQGRVISAREQHVYEVEVLPGSTALMVRTRVWGGDGGGGGGGAGGGGDAPRADLDVYVFNCTGDECASARVDGDPSGDESVIVHDPAAGMWKVVVDAASVPGGEAGYDYLDVVFNPAYGSVSVIDMPQERASGARWTTTAQGWVALAAHGEVR